MKKFNDIEHFIFLSRNANIYGFKVLKSLINMKKKPSLVILPIIQKKLDLKKKYINRYFHQKKNNFEPIEYLAKKNSIMVKRVKSINSNKTYNFLKKINTELTFICGGWPELLKKKIFNIPKFLTINIHPSYLPSFRGGDVHRWQILYPRKKTGITIHAVNKSFDHGRVIIKKSINLNMNCPIKLNLHLSNLAARLIPELLEKKVKSNYANKQSIKKKQKYYPKWDWKDKNFFFVPEYKYNILEKFVNASKNYPNIFNGPFIKIGKKEIIVRKCKTKIFDGKKLFNENFKATSKYIILKTNIKNRLCYINEIQLLNNYDWYKNKITTKSIKKNFNKLLYEK